MHPADCLPSDGNTRTNAATPSFGGTAVRRFANGPLLGRAVAVGNSGKIARSTAYANTISASVAGFSIQAVQYSRHRRRFTTAPYATLERAAAVSLNGCRVNYGTEIDADTGHTARRSLSVTRISPQRPQAENAFSLNSNTFGGKCYILNSITNRIRTNQRSTFSPMV